MMMASMPMASTVSTVSRKLSPFFTDELATASESTSAESRLAAVSKESRVRVDSSKKSVATTLPAQGRDLGHGAALHLGEGLGDVQDLGDAVRSEVGHGEQVLGPGHLSSRLPIQTPSSPTSTISSRRVGRFLPTKSGRIGQLAVAPVDHDGQLDGPGPAEIVEGVQGGPDGAAREEDVVHEHHDLPGQVDRDVGDRLGQDRAQADVVAVEGHVESADVEAVDRLDLAEDLGHLRGQRDATRLEPDEDDVFDAPVALDDLVRHAGQGAQDVGGSQDLGVGHEHAPEGSRTDCVRVRPLLLLPCEPHGTHFTVRCQL